MIKSGVPIRGVAAIVAAIVLASCSGTATTSTDSTPTTAAADLVVTMSEWRFAPANSSTPGGVPAVVELRNTGTVTHEWAVVAGDVDAEADLGDVEIVARLAVNAGSVERLVVPPLEAGRYSVVCPIPGHIANGMVGTLTVGD